MHFILKGKHIKSQTYVFAFEIFKNIYVDNKFIIFI